MRPDLAAFGFQAEDEKVLRLIERTAKAHGMDRARLHDLYALYRSAPHTYGAAEHAASISEFMEANDWPSGDREMISGWIGDVQSFSADFGFDQLPEPDLPPFLEDMRERERILKLMADDPIGYSRDQQAQNDLYDLNERLGPNEMGDADDQPTGATDARRTAIEEEMRDPHSAYWKEGSALRREYEAILQRQCSDVVEPVDHHVEYQMPLNSEQPQSDNGEY